MTPTPELIAEIDALYEKATKGPWRTDFKTLVNGEASLLMSYQAGNSLTGPGKTVSVASDRTEDHLLITALFNHWPAIKQALSTARAEDELDMDADAEVVFRTPKQMRADGVPYCPICYTFGHTHKIGCINASAGMSKHVSIKSSTALAKERA